MKRNRKTPAGAAAAAANTMRIAVPLASAMAMAMLYLAAAARCNALSKEADRREKELAAKKDRLPVEEVALHDINKERLDIIHAVLERFAGRLGMSVKITSSMEA